MTLTSPARGFALRRLEGNAADIDRRGRELVTLGRQMDATARTLKSIADDNGQSSLSTEKLAESASSIHADLDKAGTRYELTGDVLVSYAGVLETAQNWIHPRIDDITAAEQGFQNAQSALQDAQGSVNDLERTWLWEAEPTDADRRQADRAVTAASADLNAHENNRDALWGEFETTFSTWSDGYDDAVNGLQKAMDTADNNDGVWEGLNQFLTVLGWAIAVLAIVALFVSGPIGLVLLAVIAVMSVIHLVGTVVAALNGKTTWDNVVWSAIGLITFGAGGKLAAIAFKAVPRLGTIVSQSRSLIQGAVRATLPTGKWWFSLRNLSSWFTARTAAIGATPKPGWLVNPMRSIVTGSPDIVRIGNFLRNVSGNLDDLAARFPGVDLGEIASLLSKHQAGVNPTLPMQIAQLGNWTLGTTVAWGSNLMVLPKFDVPMMPNFSSPAR